MESNIKGLISAGHEMASELKAECGAVDMRSVAKLISDLATQLEVQLVRANALAEDQQKAIGSIKQADSAVKLAHEKFSALAAENAALREVVERMINQFAMSGISPEEKSINPAASLMFDAKSALSMPATDAFLAEVRAQGVEAFANSLKVAGGHEHQYSAVANEFADQLRKGGSQMSTITKKQLIEDLKASTQNSSGMFEISEETICALMSMLTNAAPQLPQPAVPDEMPAHIGPREFGRPQAYIDGWNACRAAMLKGAEPVTTAYKSPDDFICMLTGRAKYLREKGEIKSPELLERAAAALQGESVNAPSIPNGWKLVPIDPTKDMLRAGQSVVGFWLNTVHCYSKMLAAAPAAPQQGDL